MINYVFLKKKKFLSFTKIIYPGIACISIQRNQNKFYTIIFESKSLVPFDNHIYFLTKAKSFENLSEKQLLHMLHVY